ncbi:hydantoinase/oxoprolinase N-terminal domain-containing protein [Bordetella petrii]|uniref:Hydantoin utilization protein A (ORF2) n=1 Tax=Bordetella petrii (strain ATCC BAA-461 / DSM 12804 / CCUG 43448 / CIP 107267 / Se-1111R) TaxID=340100 RepID=A9IBH4_BORPD|nr:hydantoinase/oxoprolinase N-terminal domain-containing protein [Bordetella petrii]CAP41436.1 Hydantoin utilization protein A (ORF2) [Bordetella petrii]
MERDLKHLIAIDVGGTFTDLASFNRETGEVRSAKRLTNYGNFFESIAQCLKDAGVPLEESQSFKHGTTLVINALLERRGARIALVTTRGPPLSE